MNTKQKIFNGTITNITLKVEVTWYRLEKPKESSFVDQYNDYWIDAFERAVKAYEASKVVSEVENVKKGRLFQKGKWFWMDFIPEELKLGMHCQIVETGKGKCKIVKLN